MYYAITSLAVAAVSCLQYIGSKSELSAWNLLIFMVEMLVIVVALFFKDSRVLLVSVGIVSLVRIAFFIGYGLCFETQFSPAILLAAVATVRLTLFWLDWPALREQEDALANG